MNVLLVPAHPGFPGQIPQSRKTVVVVVVVFGFYLSTCHTLRSDQTMIAVFNNIKFAYDE